MSFISVARSQFRSDFSLSSGVAEFNPRNRLAPAFPDDVATQLLAAIPVDSLLVDERLRIISVNTGHRSAGFITDRMIGARFDRVLGCPRTVRGGEPCSNGKQCDSCPIGGSIDRLRNKKEKGAIVCSFQLRRESSEDLDIQLNIAPIHLGDRRYSIVAVRDITADRRHDALESIFSHDLLNTVNRLLGMATVLRDIKKRDGGIEDRFTDGILEATRDLAAEIQNQRQLLKANVGRLEALVEKVHVEKILDAVRRMFGTWPLSSNRKLVLSKPPSDLIVETNFSLLKQVLENMLKNALEASAEGEQITVDCTVHPPFVTFGVHNPSVIPEEIREKIFTPFYSTKGGNNHGIGTFSMKLLGEKYLGGAVRILSREEIGTLSLLTLPIRSKNSPA